MIKIQKRKLEIKKWKTELEIKKENKRDGFMKKYQGPQNSSVWYRIHNDNDNNDNNDQEEDERNNGNNKNNVLKENYLKKEDRERTNNNNNNNNMKSRWYKIDENDFEKKESFKDHPYSNVWKRIDNAWKEKREICSNNDYNNALAQKWKKMDEDVKKSGNNCHLCSSLSSSSSNSD